MAPPVPLSRRILKEVQELMNEPIQGISVEQDDSNARHFICVITGPGNSPYEGGQFKVDLVLPNDYPIEPPTARFMTKVYHANISVDGGICLDILKSKWSPVLQIRSVLLSLQLLLAEPNYDDPLNGAVTIQWRRNRAVAERIAKDWTRRYATPPPSTAPTPSASASSTTTQNRLRLSRLPQAPPRLILKIQILTSSTTTTKKNRDCSLTKSKFSSRVSKHRMRCEQSKIF